MASWKDYFAFNRKERNAATALSAIIIILILIKLILPQVYAPTQPTQAEILYLKNFADSIQKMEIQEFQLAKKSSWNEKQSVEFSTSSKGDFKEEVMSLKVRQFDPMLIAKEELIEMGIPNYLAKNLVNFRAKGARLCKPADVKRIYGMTDELWQEIEPNLIFESCKKSSGGHKLFVKSEPQEMVIDINTADSIDFVKLRGVGAYTASKILKFRNALGGFVSTEQVRETYRLRDSTFQAIKPYLICEPQVETINVNLASSKELAAHPYIRYNQANAIANYRGQHGPYLELIDIKNTGLVSDSLYRKLVPYLSIQ